MAHARGRSLASQAKDGDGTIDLFGVDAAGASILVRVGGFRNFFYVQLGGPPPAPPTSPQAHDASCTQAFTFHSSSVSHGIELHVLCCSSIQLTAERMCCAAELL